MGTVVEKFTREDQSYCTLRLDDGSSTISVRAWREDVPELTNLNLGDLLDLIGRVREYEGEVYLVPEVITRVEDPNWELVRELEIIRSRRQLLAQGKRPQPKQEKLEARQLTIEIPPMPEAERKAEAIEVEEIEEEPLPEVPQELKGKTLVALDKLDKGNGVTPVELAAELNLSQTEMNDVLRVLLVEGEIFEPKTNKFRRLR
jgi:RPA family protein